MILQTLFMFSEKQNKYNSLYDQMTWKKIVCDQFKAFLHKYMKIVS